MEVLNPRLVTIIDRLAHHGSDDQDILASVYGLRRLLKGDMPSELFRRFETLHSRGKGVAELRRLVQQLEDERDTLKAVNATLHEERCALEQELEEVIQAKKPKPTDGFYTYSQVVDIMREKFGKHNGCMRMWADYSAAQKPVDDLLVTDARQQKWRQSNAFPDWAVEQLLAMPAEVRPVYRWSPEDIDFLCNLHLADPHKSDEALAAECAHRFNAPCNANSIKSKLNVLRRQNRIPLCRPGRR